MNRLPGGLAGRGAMMLCALVALVVLPASSAFADDIDKAKELLRHGDYRAARLKLAGINGKAADEASLLTAKLERITGRYPAAEARAKKLTKSKLPGLADDANVFLAELERLTGRYTAAETRLAALVKRTPTHLRARWQLGLAKRDLGKTKEAQVIFDAFFDDYNAGKIDQSSAEQLFYVAEAARYLAIYEDASGTFGDAVDRDKNFVDANIAWGHLFLEKYAVGDAETSFDLVLKVNPKNPDGHAGMARVKLEQSYDIAAARHHLEQALGVNPKHIPSLLVRASIEIDQNKWDAAKKTVAEVTAINPLHFEARSLLATVYWLRDDMTAYRAERDRVLKANPMFARFYHVVARSAVREHRYKEAIELEREAVKVDPKYYEAMQAIGTGYLRLGEEKKGLSWLRKAWKGDQYNTRTFNTLNLFEEHVAKHYSFTRSPNFKLRYHNDEKEILTRYLEPLLEKAYADMVKRYKFKPKTPVIIELFSNTEHYSVRTVGLPNLGALGVCFGQVITAMSPSVGDINYAMVLWHELSHVFAIQLSNSRVPRWYTEGLSEYETVLARPEWRRENDADVYAAMKEGTLPSVAELNHGFMKPSMQQIVVAYHLSSLTIEYIARTYGFDKIVLGLKLFGKGLETPAVITKITGKSVAAFDAEFRKHLEKRLAPYKGNFLIPSTGYDDVKKHAENAKKNSGDAKAQADAALAHFFDGNAKQAKAAAERALVIDKNNKIALYVKAEVAVKTRDLATAKTTYEALIRAGGDSFDVRGRLGLIAVRQGDEKLAEKHLCTAKKLDPERSYPYQALAELYEQQGKTEAALEEMETFVSIEAMQYAPIKKLVTEYAKLKKWSKVATYGELAVDINPFDTELLLTLAKAHLESGNAKRALFHYDSVLLVKPRTRRPALAQIGRARSLKKLGRTTEAKMALAEALALEPENAEALGLKGKI